MQLSNRLPTAFPPSRHPPPVLPHCWRPRPPPVRRPTITSPQMMEDGPIRAGQQLHVEVGRPGRSYFLGTLRPFDVPHSHSTAGHICRIACRTHQSYQALHTAQRVQLWQESPERRAGVAAPLSSSPGREAAAIHMHAHHQCTFEEVGAWLPPPGSPILDGSTGPAELWASGRRWQTDAFVDGKNCFWITA